MTLFWKIVLGIIGYAIGLIAASWPTTQIGSAFFCAFPLIRRLRNYDDCFDLKGCRRAFAVTVVINFVVLALVIGAIIAWAPSPMMIGFWIGYGFTFLIGFGQWGINQNNVADFLRMLNKFIITTDKDKVMRVIEEALL